MNDTVKMSPEYAEILKKQGKEMIEALGIKEIEPPRMPLYGGYVPLKGYPQEQEGQ